jgi:hypothetical protein
MKKFSKQFYQVLVLAVSEISKFWAASLSMNSKKLSYQKRPQIPQKTAHSYKRNYSRNPPIQKSSRLRKHSHKSEKTKKMPKYRNIEKTI